MMYSMAAPITAISPRLFVPQPKGIMMLVGGEFGGPGMKMPLPHRPGFARNCVFLRQFQICKIACVNCK